MNKETYERMREMARNCNVTIVTAKQLPRPPGYKPPPMLKSEVIIMDYISRIA